MWAAAVMATRAPRRLLNRSVAYLAALAAAVLGLALAGVGVAVLRTPEPSTPVALDTDVAFTTPARVSFSGPMVIYGAPTPGPPPSLAQLGCVVTAGGGALSTDDALGEDRIVVEGRGLVPLVTFPGREGDSIGCNGPAAVAAAPLFVAPGRSGRELLPTAAFCGAALLLPVGVAGLLMLHASRP